jgi:hypothetical protein
MQILLERKNKDQKFIFTVGNVKMDCPFTNTIDFIHSPVGLKVEVLIFDCLSMCDN